MGTFVLECHVQDAAVVLNVLCKQHRRHHLQLLRVVRPMWVVVRGQGEALLIMAKVVKTITDCPGASGV